MVQTGSSRVHVVPSLDSGWTVREIADGPSLRRTNTRRGAVLFAMTLVEEAGGEVIVHRADGDVEETHAVPSVGPRPWWYSRSRVSLWITGLLFSLQAAWHLIFLPHGRLTGIWWAMMGCGLCNALVLVFSWRLDRRQRLKRLTVGPTDF